MPRGRPGQMIGEKFDFDKKTITTCTTWYNNAGDSSCKDVRDTLAIAPETFSQWNLSITLDCENWQEWWSDCVWVKAEELQLPATTTASSSTLTITDSASRSTATEWKPLGCYASTYGPNDRVSLDRAYTPAGGDVALTQSKCQSICFEVDQPFSGLLRGRECWCNDFILDGPEENSTGCNLPCSGNKTEICGVDAFFSVFEANYHQPWVDEPLKPAPAPCAVERSSSSLEMMATTATTAGSAPTAVPDVDSGAVALRVFRLQRLVSCAWMTHFLSI